ncbi:MAG TPA: class I SAM-dependent methyltransferase [Puia sp.]|nr:class I SAM-dependent methyltransferase [Puia sp.]
MKLHIGCGRNLIEGFINIDNSPIALLSKCNTGLLQAFKKFSLINEDQFAFAQTIKRRKKEFVRSNCLKLPFKDGTVDFCYTSHMLGWCLSEDQLTVFFRELHRVLRPGGALRLSFFDFDQKVSEYREHKNTALFFQQMPLGTREFNFRSKLKFLFSPNIQNGLPLNGETMTRILKQHDFRDIRLLRAGETTMETSLVSNLDLSERAGETLYVECRKAIAAA